MAAMQKKPALSASYEDEDAEPRTLAPRHFSNNRLRVICSRGNQRIQVQNMAMVKDSQQSLRPGPRIFFA